MELKLLNEQGQAGSNVNAPMKFSVAITTKH
jgi:hypothetical protein